jgi:hypothetical protein
MRMQTTSSDARLAAGVTARAIGAGVRWTSVAIAAAAPDLFAFIGASLMAYGAWLIFKPAGFLVGGLFFLVVGGVGIWRRG